MVLEPAEGRPGVDGAAAGEDAFVKLGHRMVLGIAVALFRLSGGQGQHEGGNLLADVGEILGPGGLGGTAAARFVCLGSISVIIRLLFLRRPARL